MNTVTFTNKTSIRALELAQILGQPCEFQVPAKSPVAKSKSGAGKPKPRGRAPVRALNYD
jgi:hypothetical protein